MFFFMAKRVSPIENPPCEEGLVLLLAETLFLMAAAVLMPLLITAKSDKQSIACSKVGCFTLAATGAWRQPYIGSTADEPRTDWL
ncbi:MAG: hypothetical protein HY859_01810 [Caulobacterales bacterium]|nr:hypothetical protein [Caulobacterales bacterium]